MPEMDGLTAIKQIRSEPERYGSPPVIALTAHAHPEEIASFEDAGFDAVISKPIAEYKLFAEIEKHLSGAQDR